MIVAGNCRSVNCSACHRAGIPSDRMRGLLWTGQLHHAIIGILRCAPGPGTAAKPRRGAAAGERQRGKPTAAPNVTKLRFFIMVSPFSLQLPPWQNSFCWWFNEKDAQEFRIRCTQNCVSNSAFLMEHSGGERVWRRCSSPPSAAKNAPRLLLSYDLLSPPGMMGAAISAIALMARSTFSCPSFPGGGGLLPAPSQRRAPIS